MRLEYDDIVSLIGMFMERLDDYKCVLMFLIFIFVHKSRDSNALD